MTMQTSTTPIVIPASSNSAMLGAQQEEVTILGVKVTPKYETTGGVSVPILKVELTLRVPGFAQEDEVKISIFPYPDAKGVLHGVGPITWEKEVQESYPESQDGYIRGSSWHATRRYNAGFLHIWGRGCSWRILPEDPTKELGLRTFYWEEAIAANAQKESKRLEGVRLERVRALSEEARGTYVPSPQWRPEVTANYRVLVSEKGLQLEITHNDSAKVEKILLAEWLLGMSNGRLRWLTFPGYGDPAKACIPLLAEEGDDLGGLDPRNGLGRACRYMTDEARRAALAEAGFRFAQPS